MTAVVPESLQVSTVCPLSRPFSDFDANMGPLPPTAPITTLLATDDGWDWLVEHGGDLAAGGQRLLAAAAGAAPDQWMTAVFCWARGRWSLSTRGPADFTVGAAVLEVDFGRA
ncbi:hypothetical protein [Gordonia phosphorivorans]|uniref:Uncharacterized protein n=2 Tax=Gordonia phosphorivorans TaxID=1056982 RepID=A0ABV6H481_9ACTN